MIKLRTHPAETRRTGSAQLLQVVADSAGELQPGSTVHLKRLASETLHLTADNQTMWLREVGDDDAETRLFDRL